MKVPPILGCTRFNVSSNVVRANIASNSRIIQNDSISFSSNVKYIKKYNTLPQEIKNVLSPSDAIDMFKNMEEIANGDKKSQIIGKSKDESNLYENPWLEDFYILILDGPNKNKETIYTNKEIGDSIWQDYDDARIQIVKAA